MIAVRVAIVALLGAILTIGVTALFLILGDTLNPLPPGYGVGPDPFRQARNLFRDGDTLVAFLLMGAAGGVLSLVVYRGARALIVRRREGRGLCVGCGYDLRGGTGVCPECGLTAGRAAC